jgi:hypothetical protein
MTAWRRASTRVPQPVDLVEIEAMPESRLKRIIERSKVPI